MKLKLELGKKYRCLDTSKVKYVQIYSILEELCHPAYGVIYYRDGRRIPGNWYLSGKYGDYGVGFSDLDLVEEWTDQPYRKQVCLYLVKLNDDHYDIHACYDSEANPELLKNSVGFKKVILTEGEFDK